MGTLLLDTFSLSRTGGPFMSHAHIVVVLPKIAFHFPLYSIINALEKKVGHIL